MIESEKVKKLLNPLDLSKQRTTKKVRKQGKENYNNNSYSMLQKYIACCKFFIKLNTQKVIYVEIKIKEV